MEDINTRQKMDLQISSPRVHLKNLVSALKTIGKNGYTIFHDLIWGYIVRTRPDELEQTMTARVQQEHPLGWPYCACEEKM